MKLLSIIRYNRLLNILLLLTMFAFIPSCAKYLDVKPDKSLVIPKNARELQGLLDNSSNNAGFQTSGNWGDDNYYLIPSLFGSIEENERRLYLWDPTVNNKYDWEFAYQRIFTCNVVLNSISSLSDKTTSINEIGNVEGTALFLRAYNFFQLAQIYSPQFTETSKASKLGIPLRLLPDIEAPTVRSTVEETYDQIIGDLINAIPLLPNVPVANEYKTRPSKASAYALLAKTYLIMNSYDNANKYADSCLMMFDILMDYNDPANVDLNSTQTSFGLLNPEVIFHAQTDFVSMGRNARIDSNLIKQYDNNDIRRIAYFRDRGDGTFTFKGEYDGDNSSFLFSGIASDEIYLIRAECRIRTNDISGALNDLNKLLRKRWKENTYIDYSSTDPNEVLNKVLTERRKELVFRAGLRWSDLRRLNLITASAEILKRSIEGQIHVLQPNDLRYTYLIPENVIAISGIQQNPR